jgi:hypothetical protein
MGQQLAQKWCSDCHAVGAEDAEAYVPSFVLIAEMCFSIGGLNWYSRRSTVPGLRRGKQELAAGTLTPLIMVRIQVPQPGILLKSLRICSFLARRNSLETSAR